MTVGKMNSFEIPCNNRKLFSRLSFSSLSFAILHQSMVSLVDNHLFWGPLVSSLESSFPNISPPFSSILPTLLEQISYHITTVLRSIDIWSYSFINCLLPVSSQRCSWLFGISFIFLLPYLTFLLGIHA